jgi:HPt (histidine-containing phosphotransfer) domain-containing protein
MNTTPIIIDLTYLYSLTGGDKSFEQLLLSGTVADVDEKIHGLKAAWEANEPAGVRKNAHSLVSLSAIAGMPQVEGWSRTIDQKFADGVFHPELGLLANNIIAGWPAAKQQLEEVMAAG